MIPKLFLCRECGHVQQEFNEWVCEACEKNETLDIYVKTEKPNPKLKTWTDKLAAKRERFGKL